VPFPPNVKLLLMMAPNPHPIMQTRPREGEGDRFLECRYYGRLPGSRSPSELEEFQLRVLRFLITIFKRSESEGGAKKMLTSPEKQNNRRVCEKCNEKTTISPKHGLCASYPGKMAHKAKPNKTAGEQDKVARKKPQQRPNTEPHGRFRQIRFSAGRS
jgi:hypothetical protein